MAAPRNNPIISNVRTVTREQTRNDNKNPSQAKASDILPPKTSPTQRRRISASPNISYINTVTDVGPYPSTDEVYRRDAYKENQQQPTLGSVPVEQKPQVKKPRVSDSDYFSKVNRQRSKAGQRVKTALKKAKGRLQEFDLYEDGDLRNLLATSPEKAPPFPVVIFIFALLKDLIDTAELTIIGIVITKILTIIFAVILFFWILGKASGGWWKKKVIKWLWKRYVAVIIIELIPIVGLIPANAIFVLMAHKRETKVVKAINFALEELKKAGALNHMV